MIWLWLICFSLLKAGESAAATVTGQVTLADSREPSVRERKDYSGVVVWLDAVGSAERLPAPGTFVMEQKGKKFLPHVLVVPVGATVDFPNFDPIFHNAFSNFSGQPFDTGLYAPGTSQSVHFRRPGIVRVFCNIHSTMSAVIVVLPTHLYAVTSSDGTFRLTDVPPGTYQLRFWHERSPEETLKKMERTLRVESANEKLPLVTISESGYLQVPHKNKYGKEYVPPPREHSVYPGARK